MSRKLPVFYQAPIPLNENRHRTFGLNPERNFAFAAQQNAVPLSASEFVFACRHYPIVFTMDETPLPMALVGLHEGTNYFVNRSGEWETATYVPAYVRRYPFTLMEGDAAGKYLLCIDEKSDAIIENGGDPFFDTDGAQTEATRQASEFCRIYQQDHELAKEFSAALQENGLFADSELLISVNGRQTRLTGFRAIDKEKLAGLGRDTVVSWHKNGFLDLTAHHAASMHAWNDLALKRADKEENAGG